LGDTPAGPETPAPAGADPHPVAPSQPETPTRHAGIPRALSVGMEVKVVPERQSGTPRLWTSQVTRLDHEGIWILQDKGPDALPAKAGDTVSLVVMDSGQRVTFDCPVVRVEHTVGNTTPNHLVLSPPVQQAREYSAAAGHGNRKHLRIEASLPGEAREVKDETLGQPVSIHTLNVSLSGLAFRASRAFDPGREVEVRLLAWKFPLHVRAHVVRCLRQADASFMVALSFPDELSSITRELISQYILENQRR
ncbi:MAG: PilZ domain-containing protein, partial [Candidatus Eremiobacterota bacterium]